MQLWIMASPPSLSSSATMLQTPAFLAFNLAKVSLASSRVDVSALLFVVKRLKVYCRSWYMFWFNLALERYHCLLLTDTFAGGEPGSPSRYMWFCPMDEEYGITLWIYRTPPNRMTKVEQKKSPDDM